MLIYEPSSSWGLLKEGSYLGERINSFCLVTVSCYSSGSSSGDTASGDLVTEAEWADIMGQLGGDSVDTAAGLLEVEDAGTSDSNHPSVAATELTWGATEPWREEWSTPAAAHSVTVDSINSEELMVGEPAQVDSLQIDADVSIFNIVCVWWHVTRVQTGEVGRCEVHVAATEGCQRSEGHGYWHVARDRGVMRIQIHCSGEHSLYLYSL